MREDKEDDPIIIYIFDEKPVAHRWRNWKLCGYSVNYLWMAVGDHDHDYVKNISRLIFQFFYCCNCSRQYTCLILCENICACVVRSFEILCPYRQNSSLSLYRDTAIFIS